MLTLTFRVFATVYFSILHTDYLHAYEGISLRVLMIYIILVFLDHVLSSRNTTVISGCIVKDEKLASSINIFYGVGNAVIG